MKVRKKPVVFEAYQWWPSDTAGIIAIFPEVADFKLLSDGSLSVPTLEGNHKANPGDWLIKGIKGEFYPCKPDIFQVTYERIESVMRLTDD